MRQLTNDEIKKIKLLTEKSVELTLIEPTETGLKKSIMDATGPVRIYLKLKDIHNYELQKQGEDFKVYIESKLILDHSLQTTRASLYRPKTKVGDPRIWFSGLGKYAKPNEILGIFEIEKKLYILNITALNIERLLHEDTPNPLQELVNSIYSISSRISNELLGLLNNIASRGPIEGMLDADTSIGRTLEKLLGIEINSSKKPDYKGIEIKSYRDNRGNRKNLFAQVPDWNLSKLKSSAEILENLGYPRGTDFKLYCTVNSKMRNTQGLILKMDYESQHLIENSNKTTLNDFAVWRLETLHNRLLEKHNETFWIAAESLHADGKEYFQFNQVEHTKKPIVSQFDILLELGIITLDHLIKRTIDGKVVEKGPLFKIKHNSLGLLFPPSQIYLLI